METNHEAIKAMYGAFQSYLIERAIEDGDLYIIDDDCDISTEEEKTRPEYILCDEIWDILAEAGHGCEVIIHKEIPETIYYNDFASQTDNIRFMNRLSEAMDNGYRVTVNGTNIFDLY